jgi:hypothetical protein
VRHQRRHLGVAERGEGADGAGHREGEDHRRSREARRDARQGVYAGADDRTDAERDQVRPGQGGLEALTVVGLHLGLDRLPACDKTHELSPRDSARTMARVEVARQGARSAAHCRRARQKRRDMTKLKPSSSGFAA